MLPTDLPSGELQQLDTLVVFDASDEDVEVKLTRNIWDNEEREWFSASKPLGTGESFKIVSLILPLRSSQAIQSFVNAIDIKYEAESTLITIPYNSTQNLKVAFHSNQPANVSYDNFSEKITQSE